MFGLYWLLLRKEKLLVFNRFFLVLSVVFSLVLPFITLPANLHVTQQLTEIIPTYNYFNPLLNISDPVVTSDVNISQPNLGKKDSLIRISAILPGLYISGVILFLVRFLRNIYLILRRSKLSEKISSKGYRIVLTDSKTMPYCFFSSIFLNKEDYLTGKIDKELLNHELEHVRQYHSLDIIFIELIRVFYWFNPILILYNSAVRANHEYLADNGVIKKTPDIKNYADKLLCLISCKPNISLTSGFNHSLTRKRLIMMAKSDSGQLKKNIRILLTFSLIIIFFLILSVNRSNSQSTNGETGLQAKIVKDIDGNVYNTVTIGTQVWLKENLKTTKYNDGTTIPNITVDTTWATITSGAYCDYLNTSTNSTTYGKLYNWYVTDNNTATKIKSNRGKNVCPTGWHVPSDLEWVKLKTYLGGDSVTGGKLKETGSTHWTNPNWGATNESGFTALPGGLRYYDGRFSRIWDEGYWWSSTEFFHQVNLKNATLAWFSIVGYADVRISRENALKTCGFSIRCLKDY
jgi:uncharacterized protein (TIGR02145 family)